ncbi:metallophosphoesterase [Sphingomonas sp.]|uniref:metallophosphoesterase n=1 Tax=Sphingomonas sp. TaxID=28214 RepID=UPI001B2B09D1|nr:metallophosphoesterase [Sphingomonas sp.]MBO9714107.1 metallophosphoesterase [Sphingomonas sp.]
MLRGLAGAILLVLTLYAWGSIEARSDPRVRETVMALPGWPSGTPPLRVVLIADIHAGNATGSPERLARVVTQVNALEPDLVLIAGDLLPGHAPIAAPRVIEMLTPLAGLRARLGVIAVPGNHDHWVGIDAMRIALEDAGIRVLSNQAAMVGPLALAGIDDDYTRHARLGETLAAARKLRGAHLVLSHSPDIAPELPADFPLLLAGHTHCGQAYVPGWGSVQPVTHFGDRYRCGIIREAGRTVIVTGGIGTSGPPLRFNAPPDLWVVTLKGA